MTGEDVEPVLVDTGAAAEAVGVSPATIRSWVNRGLLERKGRDRRGRGLVDLAAVIAADERTRGNNGRRTA